MVIVVAYFEEIYWRSRRGSEENHGIFNHYSRQYGRDSNRLLSEYSPFVSKHLVTIEYKMKNEQKAVQKPLYTLQNTHKGEHSSRIFRDSPEIIRMPRTNFAPVFLFFSIFIRSY
jgi:hypothetical protein